jgi:hypothetical protein
VEIHNRSLDRVILFFLKEDGEGLGEVGLKVFELVK